MHEKKTTLQYPQYRMYFSKFLRFFTRIKSQLTFDIKVPRFSYKKTEGRIMRDEQSTILHRLSGCVNLLNKMLLSSFKIPQRYFQLHRHKHNLAVFN